MAETMPLETRALALEEPLSLVPGACSWKNVAIPTEVDSAAAAGELAWYKAAATCGGKPKSASWSDVPLFFFPDVAANKVEAKTKPTAHKVEIKTKPAARVEASKAASVTSFEPAARVEREPKVVEVKIEKVEEDYIEYLRKNPMRRPRVRSPRFFKPSPRLLESLRVSDASINKLVDLEEHILEQYDTKGYAMVLAEYLDNGRKRLFRLPEEDTI
ncbi:unnamed protein product [Urochloa decumbens]|uniref:Uncharacterized protein n=1 Tax=Urochloa decumbens TaxID=240449 RepID=A0ABC8XCC1_9POAL